MSSGTLDPGIRLGKYEVLNHIATGGMATIYKARDLELRRIVALKVLPTTLARDVVLERFRREARHAARLSHPNIVTLYECGYDADHNLHYLAMEFIDGIDLHTHITRKGRLAPEEARRILIQAAKALEHAFAQGVVHRDIKPSNFLLAPVGNKIVVKMTDLGLALAEDDDHFKVTRDGTTVGTIDYLSPEQARDSRSADVRSDIYSLGCTAYHMLAGQAPFAEGGLGQRVLKHLETPPPDVRQFSPTVSPDFWDVLLKMLAKKPEERYPTPSALLNDLKSIVAADGDAPPTPTPSRRKTACVSDGPTLPHIPAAPPVREEQRPEEPPPEAPARWSPAVQPAKVPADTPALVTSEQQRTAAAFHERAVQVLAEGGGHDYALELLGNCLKLDPFTLQYRQTLREITRKNAGSTLGRWFGSLNGLSLKSKMRAALTAGEWRKVLEFGEDVLTRQPADVEAHLEMAEAAVKLDLPELAMWLLEQARELLPQNLDLMRAMARLFEKRREWKPAIALWERVGRAAPDDPDFRRKIDDLAIQEHLNRGRSRR